MIDKLRDNIRDGQPIVYAAENGALERSSISTPAIIWILGTSSGLILTEPPPTYSQLQNPAGQWVIFTGRPQTLAGLLPNANIDVVAGVDNHDGFMGGIVGPSCGRQKGSNRCQRRRLSMSMPQAPPCQSCSVITRHFSPRQASAGAVACLFAVLKLCGGWGWRRRLLLQRYRYFWREENAATHLGSAVSSSRWSIGHF